MAAALQRLISTDAFGILQEKLEKWYQDYHLNTCDQNVARGCEIIELNARIQSQLFKLLSLCATEGGVYGGSAVIKSRLLPLLGSGFFSTGLSSDTSLAVLAEAGAKRRDLDQLRRVYEESLQDLDIDLKEVKDENRQLREELDETREELERQSRASASEKMFTEAEIRQLRSQLTDKEIENDRLRARMGYPPDVPRSRPISRAASPLPPAPKEPLVESSRPLPLPFPSPLAYESQQVTQQSLISRFNDLFSISRLDAMNILRRYTDDHENNQRIIFATVMESFQTARTEFHAYKNSLRSRLLITHRGPETLEEAVQLHINRYPEPVDISRMTSDVIRGLSRNPTFSLPSPMGYEVILGFIRECSVLAWQMTALPYPLDVAPASDAELFDEYRYRRSYDSEYAAPLVHHHIWPSLMQGARVIMKGEACTKRSFALSPRQSYAHVPASRPLSRSASPVKNGSGKAIANGSSRSFRSRSPDATARSTSTRLSHYM